MKKITRSQLSLIFAGSTDQTWYNIGNLIGKAVGNHRPIILGPSLIPIKMRF